MLLSPFRLSVAERKATTQLLTFPIRGRLRLPLTGDRHVLLDVFGIDEHRERETERDLHAPVFVALPGIGSDSSFGPVQELICE